MGRAERAKHIRDAAHFHANRALFVHRDQHVTLFNLSALGCAAARNTLKHLHMTCRALAHFAHTEAKATWSREWQRDLEFRSLEPLRLLISLFPPALIAVAIMCNRATRQQFCNATARLRCPARLAGERHTVALDLQQQVQLGGEFVQRDWR